jgi:hypothetical protein
LTSIKFAWHSPDGRGTAIVGYLIEVQHTGKQFKLPRSQQWIDLENLLPGKSYYIRLKSLNSVGESEWSEYNTFQNSHTLTDVPEKPSRPISTHGTWKSINVLTRLPYNNGSPITSVVIHKRWVEAFNKGEWENPIHMNLEDGQVDPNVDVVEYVENDAYIQMLLQEEIDEAEERKKGSNPLKVKKKILSLSEKLNKAKPEGSTLSLTIDGLRENTIYEFRVSYVNFVGTSVNSDASHRAKTNAALPPDAPQDFRCFDILLGDRSDDAAQIARHKSKDKAAMFYGIACFQASFDRQGGAYITSYVIQCRNNTVDKDELNRGVDPGQSAASHKVTFQRSPPNAPLTGLYFKVDDLVCGNVYQFRVRADNSGANDGIPEGIYSDWTEEVTMPELPEDEEEDDAMSFSTRKTEPTYVEIDDDDDDDDDSLVGFDVLDQELPTSRVAGQPDPKRKGAVILKSVGKKGEVEEQKRLGMERRGGRDTGTERSTSIPQPNLDPGSF